MDGMIGEQSDELSTYRWRIFEPWREVVTVRLTTRTAPCGEFTVPGKSGAGRSPVPGESVREPSVRGELAGGGSDFSLGNDDADPAIRERRRLLERHLRLKSPAWAMGRQVHGTGIADAESIDKFTEADAVYLRSKNIVAGVLLADCHPVLIYDPLRHVGVAAHAGWRGTIAGIAAASVRRLLSDGSRAEDLIAAVGPGIGRCCYEIGAERAEAFSRTFAGCPGVLMPGANGESWFLDIAAANAAMLRSAGVEKVGRGGFCTACRPGEFFSFRREGGSTGRQAALMVLR